MLLRGGKNPNFNWSRAKWNDLGPNQSVKLKFTQSGSNNLWGSNINKGSTGVLKGLDQMLKQILIAMTAVRVQAEHFRVLVGERSIAVFRNSFKYHKFYSANSTPWHPLSDYTLNKRAKKGTGSRILVEYGDLRDSFELTKNAGPMTTRVSTGIVQPNPKVSKGQKYFNDKKYAICYAGWHNEGEGTYGNGWGGRQPKQYIKRQFMGHSTYLNPITNSFLRKMMKMYLFDSVFRIPKG